MQRMYSQDNRYCFQKHIFRYTEKQHICHQDSKSSCPIRSKAKYLRASNEMLQFHDSLGGNIWVISRTWLCGTLVQLGLWSREILVLQPPSARVQQFCSTLSKTRCLALRLNKNNITDTSMSNRGFFYWANGREGRNVDLILIWIMGVCFE